MDFVCNISVVLIAKHKYKTHSGGSNNIVLIEEIKNGRSFKTVDGASSWRQ